MEKIIIVINIETEREANNIQVLLFTDEKVVNFKNRNLDS